MSANTKHNIDELVSSLMKVIIEKGDKEGVIYCHLLTFIKSVDGIDCNVRLILRKVKLNATNTMLIQLEIEPKFIEACIGSGRENWTYYDETIQCKINTKSVKEAFEKHLNILEDIKFDKIKCKFFPKIKLDFELALQNAFKSLSNVKTKIDKCCVCHEETSIKTKCNHSLCIPCADKIKVSKKNCNEDNEDSEDEECSCCYSRKCPMCRQGDVTFMPHPFTAM